MQTGAKECCSGFGSNRWRIRFDVGEDEQSTIHNVDWIFTQNFDDQMTYFSMDSCQLHGCNEMKTWAWEWDSDGCLAKKSVGRFAEYPET